MWGVVGVGHTPSTYWMESCVCVLVGSQLVHVLGGVVCVVCVVGHNSFITGLSPCCVGVVGTTLSRTMWMESVCVCVW